MRRKQTTPSDYSHAQLTVAAVALEFGVPELDLNARLKGTAEICFARQVAMYLLHVIFNINLTRTAQIFARDRSTVSHACNVVEDSRDDMVFNMKLERLETFLSQAPQLLSSTNRAA